MTFCVRSVSCFSLEVVIGKVMPEGRSVDLLKRAPLPSMMAKKRCACELPVSLLCSSLPVPTVT